MKNFIYKYRWWILITFAFLVVRIFVFETFWLTSLGKGGWGNFYSVSQASYSTLQGLFHEYCDWHPPLYYTFASVLLYLFKSQWVIYAAQTFLSFLTLVFAYKTVRLFFSEKISLISVFILAVEPYWAWHNILLASENLSVPLFLTGLYFFLKFLKSGGNREIIWSAIFMALTTLARANNLFVTIVLSVVLIILYFLRRHVALEFLARSNLKKLLWSLVFFNLIFFSLLAPWFIHNKIIYGRFTIANVTLTNFYFYNLAPLISLKENISYQQAFDLLKKKADEALGPNVGNLGDCKKFSRAEFNHDIDFYQSQTVKYIASNFWLYAKIHLVKAVPFYLQSGYLDLWAAYGGDNIKPDLGSLVLSGNFSAIYDFFAQGNFKVFLQFLGTFLWGLATLALCWAVVYSYFKDRDKFLFFLLSFIIIAYNAILTSPFLGARYRLPLYILFIAPLVYLISKLIQRLKRKKK